MKKSVDGVGEQGWRLICLGWLGRMEHHTKQKARTLVVLEPACGNYSRVRRNRQRIWEPPFAGELELVPQVIGVNRNPKIPGGCVCSG